MRTSRTVEAITVMVKRRVTQVVEVPVVRYHCGSPSLGHQHMTREAAESCLKRTLSPRKPYQVDRIIWQSDMRIFRAYLQGMSFTDIAKYERRPADGISRSFWRAFRAAYKALPTALQNAVRATEGRERLQFLRTHNASILEAFQK